MPLTLAFDVYGTLINPHGVVSLLSEMMGEKAQVFSNSWRAKQLEYSFRRALMKQYVPFSQCTSEALEFTCLQYQVALSDQQKQTLLTMYLKLPAFNDTLIALQHLKTKGYRLFAFSNGTYEAVASLLNHAQIAPLFEGIISTDEVRSFKPDPAVYQHFLEKTQATAKQAWLISSNPFDVTGAIASGMKAIWIQRDHEANFDPWDIQPTSTSRSLHTLDTIITANKSK